MLALSLTAVWEMSAVQMAGIFFFFFYLAWSVRDLSLWSAHDISSINMAAVGCGGCGLLGRLQERCQATVQAFDYS